MTLTIGPSQITPAVPEASRPPPDGGSLLGIISVPTIRSEVAEIPIQMGGATNQMVSLWIDLVRQAFPAAAPLPMTAAAAGLTSRQLNALDCISREGITMTQLARALRVTESCATALADHLVVAGAISRERDSADRRLVRVSMTEAGSGLAATYRRDLEAGLLQLLSQLAPAKLTAVTLAMTQLGDRDQSGTGDSGASEAPPALVRGTDSEQGLDDA